MHRIGAAARFINAFVAHPVCAMLHRERARSDMAIKFQRIVFAACLVFAATELYAADSMGGAETQSDLLSSWIKWDAELPTVMTRSVTRLNRLDWAAAYFYDPQKAANTSIVYLYRLDKFANDEGISHLTEWLSSQADDKTLSISIFVDHAPATEMPTPEELDVLAKLELFRVDNQTVASAVNENVINMMYSTNFQKDPGNVKYYVGVKEPISGLESDLRILVAPL